MIDLCADCQETNDREVVMDYGPDGLLCYRCSSKKFGK